MKLKRTAAAFSAAAILLLGGCNGLELGFEDVLRPPKTMGDEAEIEKLISSSAGSGYTLKYPKSGSYRSAIIMQDLDGDEVDEAIAFFKVKDELTNVKMLVMSELDGVWSVSGDFSTETTDVDCVDFADIDDRDGYEIIVSYTTYTPNTCFLSCYSYSNGETDAIKSGQSCSAFCCGNLDGNGKSEIIALSLFSADVEAKAVMLEYSENKKALFARSSAAMDPNVIKYRGMSFSDFSNGVRGLVVDGSFADEQVSTQVIYFNQELALLRNPLYKEKEKSVTRRAGSVLSADIDNDRNVEIPVIEKLPYSGTDTSRTIADKLIWYNFDPEDESLVKKSVMTANFGLNYTIKIPEVWQSGSYTALIDSSDNAMIFYEWTDNELGQELFRIKAFDISQWDLGKENDDYSLIYRDTKYAYSFKNTSGTSALSVSDDKIKTSFSVLDGAYE